MSSENKILMINLATDRSAPIAKALRFGRKFLAGGWDVHLLLNVDGVRLVDPSADLYPCPVTGNSLEDMLTVFLKDGGKGLVGAECMKLIGLKEEDLQDGLESASFSKIEALMLQPNIKILSY